MASSETQRRIVVTGAASGIGLALSAMLLDENAEVIAIDRTDCSIQGVTYLSTDIADLSSIPSQLTRIAGPISGIANVAGISGVSDATEVIATNFLGPRVLTESLLSRLSPCSSIVNVSSISAGSGGLSDEASDALMKLRARRELDEFVKRNRISGNQAYRASKKAISDWSCALAAQLIGARIRVNCISPGPVTTPLLKDFRRSMGDRAIDRAAKVVGRHGTPAEAAQVIRFLLNGQSSWINGTNIRVDGGLMAHNQTRSSKQLRRAHKASNHL